MESKFDFCSFCNTKIFDSDRICPSCGAPITKLLKKSDDGKKVISYGMIYTSVIYNNDENEKSDNE